MCAACAEPLREAAVLHRGAVLEGFGLRDSAAFDDWQFFTNNLADLSRQAGDHEASMRYLREAVVLFAEVGEPGGLSPEIWKLTAW